MKKIKNLDWGLLSIATANTVIGLFIVEDVIFKSISFLLATIGIGLMPSKNVWNYIIITLATIVVLIYITNHLINS